MDLLFHTKSKILTFIDINLQFYPLFWKIPQSTFDKISAVNELLQKGEHALWNFRNTNRSIWIYCGRFFLSVQYFSRRTAISPWLLLLFWPRTEKTIFNKNFTQPGFQILQPFYMIETVKIKKKQKHIKRRILVLWNSEN